MRKHGVALCLLSLLLGTATLHAAARYTFSSGDLQNVPVDPFFLDPGDDVVDFYSYGSPVGSSANTGFEQYDTALVYMTLDDTGEYGLVVVCDRPGGGGGNASLSISGFPDGASLAQSDDPGEAGGVQLDGTATCNWNWVNCCTDGAAYRLGTGSDFTLSLNFTFNSGLDTLRFISFDPCAQEGGMLFTDLDESFTLTITSEEVPDGIPDCNENNRPDFCDIYDGTSFDCNQNEIPDECEDDCNGNGLADECDLASGYSLDCNLNLIPDECELDCNGNGIPDECDLTDGTSADCNANGIPDECDLAEGTSADCNSNGIPDECDLAAGTSPDCNGNGVPDECDLASGLSADCNENGMPDECDIAYGISQDQNGNGVPDECEITVGASEQPAGFELKAAAPNPFNPSTWLNFSLPETMEARLVIHDLRGREVALLQSGLLERGEHSIRFDANGLSAGIYLASLQAEGQVQTQKLVLLK